MTQSVIQWVSVQFACLTCVKSLWVWINEAWFGVNIIYTSNQHTTHFGLIVTKPIRSGISLSISSRSFLALSLVPCTDPWIYLIFSSFIECFSCPHIKKSGINLNIRGIFSLVDVLLLDQSVKLTQLVDNSSIYQRNFVFPVSFSVFNSFYFQFFS